MVSIDDVASKEEAIERFELIIKLSNEIFDPNSIYLVVDSERVDLNKKDNEKTVVRISLIEDIITLYDKKFENKAEKFRRKYREILNDDFVIKTDYS